MSDLKGNYTNELIYKTGTDLQTYRYRAGEEGWEEIGSLGLYKLYIQSVYIQLGLYVHAATFKMDNWQGPIGQHRELCSMLCGSLDGRGVSGRVDAHV